MIRHPSTKKTPELGCVYVCVCVCVCVRVQGKPILKRETRMGPGPPWSPEAPPKPVQRTLGAPSCQALPGSLLGSEPLVAWGLCDLCSCTSMPGRVVQLHACPLRGGGGVWLFPSSLEGQAPACWHLPVTLGPLS